MKTLNVLSKAALFLLLISISTTASAWGWGLSRDTHVLPVSGEMRGDANWVAYEVGTGPCGGYTPIPDPIPPVSDPPTFANVQTVTTSQGIVRPLGRVVVESAHCAEGPLALEGTMTLYAAGGTLEAVYTAETLFIMPMPEPPLFLPAMGSIVVLETAYTITGGTGHFESAGGTLMSQEFVRVGDYGYADEMTWSIRRVIAGHILFAE